MAALNKFQSKTRSILMVTDVASRGLDIPHVDCVVNFDLPQDSKVRRACLQQGLMLTYIHTHPRTTSIALGALPEPAGAVLRSTL